MPKKNKLKVLVAMSPHKSLRDSAGQAGAHKKRVIIAMSGGVDSSVAAKLLVDQGFSVAGIFLHFWREDSAATNADHANSNKDFENKCCSSEALNDARRVCQKIGIPFYTLNFSQIFKREVVDDFIKEYEIGRTPNPCVRCNKLVKLGLLIKKAEQLGFDYVATGHYVRSKKLSPVGREVRSKKYIYKLYRAQDKNKDQSYFLYTLNQAQLKYLLFPLANYTKTQVRKMAKRFKLPVAEKKESQEICFISEKSPNDFLRRYLKLKPGPIKLLTLNPLDNLPAQTGGGRGIKGGLKPPYPSFRRRAKSPSPPLLKGAVSRKGGGGEGGEVLGQHHGLPPYTIGQRKGIAIGGIGPFYVAKKDFKTNTLYVVNNRDDKALHSDKLIAQHVNWISGKKPKLPIKCSAVIRYGHEAVGCIITPLSPHPLLISPLARGRKEEGVIVKFAKLQRAVTAGQSVVFYQGEELIGGGIIE